MTIDVKFIDDRRQATEKPNPKFPNGMPVNLAADNVLAKTCTRNLPYPAPRCGFYEITCRTCGIMVVTSVAGRPDDPNIITLPCKAKGMN